MQSQQNNNLGHKILHLPNEMLIMILQLGEEIELQCTAVFTMLSSIFAHSFCPLISPPVPVTIILHTGVALSYQDSSSDVTG